MRSAICACTAASRSSASPPGARGSCNNDSARSRRTRRATSARSCGGSTAASVSRSRGGVCLSTLAERRPALLNLIVILRIRKDARRCAARLFSRRVEQRARPRAGACRRRPSCDGQPDRVRSYCQVLTGPVHHLRGLKTRTALLLGHSVEEQLGSFRVLLLSTADDRRGTRARRGVPLR
jgi:hypothetical protein